jgi:histidine triad (HIT) family protein
MTQDKNCIFCKIIKGEIPPVKIWEDKKCIVILDKFPATKGQSLVIPKKHEEYIMNLDDETYNHLFNIAKKISKALDSSLKTFRTCFVVEGFAVPHVHIRLHPCYESRLLLAGKEENNENLQEVAKKIKIT